MCAPRGQVVDKHFNDNWVIPVYMGILADLSEEWAPYKAAREALAMDCLQVRCCLAPTRTHTHPRAPTRTHTHPHAPTRTHTHPHAPTRTHTHPLAPTQPYALCLLLLHICQQVFPMHCGSLLVHSTCSGPQLLDSSTPLLSTSPYSTTPRTPQPKNARDLAVRHRTNMGAGNRDVDAYLVEGILTEQVPFVRARVLV
jgi:hypothetical protein